MADRHDREIRIEGSNVLDRHELELAGTDESSERIDACLGADSQIAKRARRAGRIAVMQHAVHFQRGLGRALSGLRSLKIESSESNTDLARVARGGVGRVRRGRYWRSDRHWRLAESSANLSGTASL